MFTAALKGLLPLSHKSGALCLYEPLPVSDALGDDFFETFCNKGVDASVIRGTTARDCSGGNGPTTLETTELGRGMSGKGAPKVDICFLRQAGLGAQLETFPACMYRGHLRVYHCLYKGAFHSTPPFFRLERVIRLRRG